MKIKTLILSIFLIIISNLSHSQSNVKTFDITDRGSAKSTEINKYENAVLTANMESYRNKTSRTKLQFVNGLTIELLSAQELYILGVNINPSDYTDSRDPRFTFPIFDLSSEGYLLALYKSIGK